MGSYHAAVAPIAYVKSLIWLHTLACDLNEIYYTPHDFDGDRLSDPALFCEASGNWQMLLSNQPRSWRLTNNLAIKSEPIQFALGGPGAVPVLRDFDGDRLADGKDRRTELCATGLSRKLTNKIDFERGVLASRSFHLY